MRYNHKTIEQKWQERWAASHAFEARDGDSRPKQYLLIEFPYPSGDGLHVGHLRPYVGMDVIARKRRMEGKNVLYPIGWDAFGLPTENYALKTGVHPSVATERNIANLKRQIQMLGISFDWSREVNTTDPAYYKWTQWIFLKLLEHGLAYKARIPINWCVSCKIGLANEEAVGGVCERCGGPVEKRDREQWMLKITAYAERLLSGLEHVDYIERAKVQQVNWIGKSEGALIPFRVIASEAKQSQPLWSDEIATSPSAPRNDTTVEVFTTRPDTLFGATYLVLAPEHAAISNLKSQISNWPEVEAYIAQARKRTEIERTAEEKEKTGVELKGVRAINPANGEEIPVWIADYVLAHYGTGAIMGVPAHDERDFVFAKKYGLPIRQVVRKIGAPIRSYVMGAAHITEDDFSAIDVVVTEKTENGNYKVEIPRDRVPAFEDLISEKMSSGFWNEYVGEETIFLFKHKDGRVERLVLDARNTERIDRLACEFNNEPYDQKDPGNYINGALARNEWYRPLIVHSDPGVLMNSGTFTGMASEDAKRAITEAVGGKMTMTYKLRDWVFSRQRYWGEPIPVVFCANCVSPPRHSEERSDEESHNDVRSLAAARDDERGKMIVEINGVPHAIVPVPENQLPVLLPEVERYQPTDTGDSPLAAIPEWVNTTCPTCGGPAKRETDVMPNWAGSSWYFLAYLMRDTWSSAKKYSHILQNVGMSSSVSLDMSRYQEAFRHWLPVDWYNGGMEHTTLHLLYSRFWHRFLYDIGTVPKCSTPGVEQLAEPYRKRTSHGLILAADGEKMSKSRGNVVNPDEIVERFGADAVRVYEMFIGPFDQPVPWSTDGLIGCRRFLEKVRSIGERLLPVRHSEPFDLAQDKLREESHTIDPALLRLLHRTVKKVTDDIEAMRFNTAVSALMEFVNALGKRLQVSFSAYRTLLVLLAPFAPHVCEELWEDVRLSPPHSPSQGEGEKTKKGFPTSRLEGGQGGEGNRHGIFSHPWPTYDPAPIIEDEVDLVVQVNGKVRATIHVSADISEDDARARALAEPNVAKYVGEKQVKKIIFVPKRLINIVV